MNFTRKFLFGLLLSSMLIFSLIIGVFGSSVWSQTYGGEFRDEGYCVIQIFDGFIVAGGSDSIRDGGFWIIKIDLNGNLVWEKTCTQDSWDTAMSVIQTSEGDFVISGGSTDVCLVKTDNEGNVLWQKYFESEWGDQANSVAQTIDGGFIIGGASPILETDYLADDLLLMKTDANGNEQWLKTFGGDSYDRGGVAIPTNDGGYALGGLSGSFGAGNTDYWLIKTDSDGNHLWNQTYGGFEHDDFVSMIQTNDGGFALVGSTQSFGAGDLRGEKTAIWLVKTDINGNMEWSQRYGETLSIIYGESIVQTSDGGYAIGGRMFMGDDENVDCLLIKTDSNGNQQWNQTFGGPYRDGTNSIIQTSDGGYALAGFSYPTPWGEGQPDCLLIKTDEYGVIPEFSSWIILPLVVSISFIVLITKKKLEKKN